MEDFNSSLVEIVQEESHKFLAIASKVRKNNSLMETSNEKILLKINQLDNELDFFI